jgi:hypothetical protein
MDQITSGNLVQHDDMDTGLVIGPMPNRGGWCGYWQIYWSSGHFGGAHFSELKILKTTTKQGNINA